MHPEGLALSGLPGREIFIKYFLHIFFDLLQLLLDQWVNCRIYRNLDDLISCKFVSNMSYVLEPLEFHGPGTPVIILSQNGKFIYAFPFAYFQV